MSEEEYTLDMAIRDYEKGSVEIWHHIATLMDSAKDGELPAHDDEKCESNWYSWYYDYSMTPTLVCTNCWGQQ